VDVGNGQSSVVKFMTFSETERFINYSKYSKEITKSLCRGKSLSNKNCKKVQYTVAPILKSVDYSRKTIGDRIAEVGTPLVGSASHS
jgi:hypothetical protein